MTDTLPRTRLEREANDFDAQLFALLERASEFARGEGGRFTRSDRELWKEVAYALRTARPYVRQMMHAKDREQTV
jgi:hypothetical protein